MARGKAITDFESEVISLGLKNGANKSEIAKVLGRSKQSIYQYVSRMNEASKPDPNQYIMDIGKPDE